jgi:glycine betaine/choline ABC-type transport system substrate-binding protein/ABC-type proline/glycine betaine transport system permease subunit
VAEGARVIGDALDLIFHSRESLGGNVEIGGSHLLPLLGKHLEVTAEAMLAACLLAIPPALWLAHTRRGQVLTASVANVGRALPPLAVLLFTSSFAVFGLSTRNLVFAMVILAIPPIFTNTYVGIRQVEPDVVDAARGMGMTGPQIVRRVELPLALPLVFGGVRTSVVNVLATASLGPLVAVDTLGEPILAPNVYGESGRLAGVILIAALALTFEAFFAMLQRAATPKGLSPPPTPRRKPPMRSRTMAALLALFAVFMLAACGDDDDKGSATSTAARGYTAPAGDTGKQIKPVDGAGGTPQIVMGSKNFTEEFILGEIYAQTLEAAGYKVKRQFNLGSEQIAYKAVKGDKVDAYPEYTGTMLTSFYGVKPDAVPLDPDEAYEQAKEGAAKDDITALARTPYTNSNGFAVTQETADKLGVKTLSDLKGKSQDLTISGGPECRQRQDCLLGLQDTYGLKFKKFLSIDLAKREEVITKGQTDVGLVFTTDGQIAADKLVVLEDDKQLFPPYNATLLVRNDVIESHPGMQEVLEQVQADLTDEAMQELNSRVDLDKQKPAEVAKAYLTESGYLPS